MQSLVYILGVLFAAGVGMPAWGQQTADSIRTKQLGEVVIRAPRESGIQRLPPVSGTRIWSGKKNDVIPVGSMDANITEKTARQVFAKIPGVFVYDMDGTGNQVNIATRGLDPHRGWEFNIRRDDALTNSDMYGYPASHYSAPMESIERIQLVRGTGSLQYGAQFGGMLNYITKKADTTRRIAFESIHTMGSFGLLSTYNAVGGRVGKVDYYGYVNKRIATGYRDHSRTVADAEAAIITCRVSESLSLIAEFSHSNYIFQLPGQLTDSMFHADPKQSSRSRNYYNPDIYVPSLYLEWKLSEHSRISWMNSAVLGSRNSVMFDKPADIADEINALTSAYAPRQVDIDNYHSYTSELRWLQDYRFLNHAGALAVGAQVMRNNLHRRQQGQGTTGADFDLSLTSPGWGRDLRFKTHNVAFFLENKFNVLSKVSLTPGLRVELGESDLSGTTVYYDAESLPNTITHNSILMGISAQVDVSDRQNFYAGWAQAYRPVVLKDIVPASVYERVDKNLDDAEGYNFEAGYRGQSTFLRWDVGVFQLRYNNRMGILSLQDEQGNFYLYRTNIGNSMTNGAELFVEYFLPFEKVNVSVFTSTSWMDARYRGAQVRVGDRNVSIDGHKVESVPEFISRNGLNVRVRSVSTSLLYSYTAESYADALNTSDPSPNGAIGKVPGYGILDINTSWRISGSMIVRFNVNNVCDKQYFTKRPQFYPGPGVWPSDGRSYVVTVGITI